MKKLLLGFIVALTAIPLFSDTAIIDGIEWNYQVNDGEAEIFRVFVSSAIPEDTSGSITIPSSLGGCPVTSIGYWAFSGCSGITSITIPNSVTSIRDGAFSGCNEALYDLETIPGVKLVDGWVVGYTEECPAELDLIGVRGIGYNAFAWCDGLTSVMIGNSVTSIGNEAFYLCSGLTSVTIPNSVTSIGDRAFYNCSGLTSITIPNSVTSIGDYAFAYCDGLTSVTIGNSVTSIGDYAFSGCIGLTSVTIPNSVTSIGDSVFSSCIGLTSITIPNSVTSIGDGAFSSCIGLTSITIPNSVTSIGDYAFAWCDGLTSITIPNSVASIGDGAFSGCIGLTQFIVDSNNPNYKSVNGLLLSNDGKTLIAGINGDVVIPDGVTSIESETFSSCDGLTSITIPNSVTSIGDYAFAYCDGLTSITIPNSVTSIGDYAFFGCSGLTQFIVGSNNPNYKSVNGLLLSNDGKTLIAGINGDVVIPDGVTIIESKAFSRCDGLTSITIPNSVTSIGDSAFAWCDGLTSIMIPNSVTNIGSEAFDGCIGLTSITIPNSVTSIGDSAFSSCSGLTSITIPNSVTSIGDWAFSYCYGLTSVTIPNSVTSIGSYAFYACSGLTSITIPNSVTSIGDYAFCECWQLEEVIFLGNAPVEIGWDVFGWDYESVTIMVIEGTYGWDGDYTSTALPETWHGYRIQYAEKYIVQFNANGGEGEMVNQTVVCGADQALSKNKFIREGYMFVGWATSANGDLICCDGGSAKNISSNANDIVNLYAVWGTASLPDAEQGVAYNFKISLENHMENCVFLGSPSCSYMETFANQSFASNGSANGWQAVDNYWSYDLPFNFPFFGENKTRIYINSNGTINFTTDGASDYSESLGDLKSRPMIAVLWDDLTTYNGDIYIFESTNYVTIRWAANYYSSDSVVNFSATLYKSGKIVLSYGSGNANGGLIGISSGDGENYLLSSMSQSGSMNNARDIVFAQNDSLESLEGLSISADGILSGTVPEVGEFDVTIYMLDGNGNLYEFLYTLNVVENSSAKPIFDELSHSEGYINLEDLTSIDLFVSASDPEGKEVSYSWVLDGVEVSTASSYTYVRGDNKLHNLSCIVRDDTWTGDGVRVDWQIGVLYLNVANKEITLFNGQPLKLEVELVSSLDYSLTWYDENGKSVGTGETIVLENISEDTSFYAVATSAMGEYRSEDVKVTVVKSPYICNIFKTTGAVVKGNRLVLRTMVYGEGPYEYEWKHKPLGKSDYVSFTKTTEPCLDISTLTSENIGDYVLKVKNAYGEATSEPFTVKLAATGSLVQWGADGHGRTQPPEGLTGVVDVFSGMNCNIAITTNGTLHSWGYNGHGVCDIPENLNNVNSIAIGGYESNNGAIAVKNDGSLVAWGTSFDEYWYENWYWDDFDGGWYEYVLASNGVDVTQIPNNLTDVVQVSIGDYCAMALKKDGTITIWGDDNNYTYTEYLSQIPVDAQSNIVAVATAGVACMALRADGRVVVWTAEDYMDSWIPPVDLSDVVQIGVQGSYESNNHFVALKRDGSIVVWGDDWSVDDGEYNGNYIQISAGEESFVALDQSGNVHYFGNYYNYNLEDIPNYASPAFSIISGGYHVSAIVSDVDGDSIGDKEEVYYGRNPEFWENSQKTTINGYIYNSMEEPVTNAFVFVYLKSACESNIVFVGHSPTDVNGMYSIDGVLPSPNYLIHVEADGYVDEWYENAIYLEDASCIQLGDFQQKEISEEAFIVEDILLEFGQAPANGVLKPDSYHPAEDGDVDISLPEDAIVYVDMWPVDSSNGEFLFGEVPASHAMGIAAPRLVTVKLQDDKVIPETVKILYAEEGERADVEVAIDGPVASLSITTEPQGANVYLDYADSPIGVTPLMIDNVLAASHSLLIEKEGYLRPRPIWVSVSTNELTEIYIPLVKNEDGAEQLYANVSTSDPGYEVYVDYLPTGEVTPVIIGGMDPASHSGLGWYSASHTIMLRGNGLLPIYPRCVPEGDFDEIPEISIETKYLSSIGYAEALDTEENDEIKWLSGGGSLWFAQTNITFDAVDAVQSGKLADGKETWLETTVKGAGTIKYKRKVSCENRFDGLIFYIDDVQKERVTGETDWVEKSFVISDVSEHTLKWVYRKSASGVAGSDAAWLDMVEWIPDVAANARTLTVESEFDEINIGVGEHKYAWGDHVIVSSALTISNETVYATCTGWSGTGSVPSTGRDTSVAFTITDDSSIVWNWDISYMLNTSTSSGGSIDVESGWVKAGSQITITATPEQYMEFVGWVGDITGCEINGNTIIVPMSKARSIQAKFKHITHNLEVYSECGNPTPTNGIYSILMGNTITASVDSVVYNGENTNYVCQGWTGTGSVPAIGTETNVVFTVLEESSIIWNWETNYFINVSSSGSGSIAFNNDWYVSGTNVVISLYPFENNDEIKLSGDIEDISIVDNQISFVVTQSRNIDIEFIPLSIEKALDTEKLLDWMISEDCSWIAQNEVSFDGEDAAAVALNEQGTSALTTTIQGSGKLSFYWNVVDPEVESGGLDLYVNGEYITGVFGQTEWTEVCVDLPTGDNEIMIEYWCDGMDQEIMAFVDNVVWSPSSQETETTPVPVPFSWLDEYIPNAATDYEAAASKTGANGVAVWESYVAGLDPNNPNSKFMAIITMVDNEPVITWTPDLKEEREYIVEGKENLNDVEWESPANSNHRFFRIKVKLK